MSSPSSQPSGTRQASSSPRPENRPGESPNLQPRRPSGARYDTDNSSGSTEAHARAISIGSDSVRRPSMSSSAPHREPIRSFLHELARDVPAAVDGAQHARSVRQDTSELASYFLSDRQGSPFRARWADRRHAAHNPDGASISSNCDADDDSEYAADDGWSIHRDVPSVILEASEPPSPPEGAVDADDDGPSLIASMLRRSPASTSVDETASSAAGSVREGEDMERVHSKRSTTATPRARQDGATEATPLLGNGILGARDADVDIENQKGPGSGGRFGRHLGGLAGSRLKQAGAAMTSKDVWNRHNLWTNAVVAPVTCLPAVAVGLLLNILDGLSYGMILFPLGNPIFSKLGPAGMSIFYISTIISQLTFSSGSIFKGAIGSELIEVVPFFHNMAGTIADSIKEDGNDAIIATTIVSYAVSSMVTGLVFYLMGRFHFGYVVGFIPRHILTGCIGGVGWFLVATGFEVSARLEGSLEYNLATLKELVQPEKLPLWIIPLVLAILLFWGQSRGSSKYFLPLYILCIPVLFYLSIAAFHASPQELRNDGWIFDGPPAEEPWWYFYTLYQFKLVRWDAIAETIPAMLALTFFGILHVPINVPALARQCGEDDADLDVELRLHGYSNFVSGMAGSIQNYLVYANTTFFMRSGGDQRLAGFMLAGLTALVMMIGPSIIGFIPVMMVGTLIFDLGFELLLEALWEPRKKLRLMEYATVVVIVLVMGVYDFVIGIGVGILLAFVSLIVQSSRVSPVRGSYTGDIVTSTVRRNPSQHSYLQRAGKQIYMIKLTGYLFFGTIVSVEAKIRALVANHSFDRNPIRYVVIDMWHVMGLDYSAGEGFNTINRLLGRKGVTLVLSGVDGGSELGKSLRMVGIGVEDSDVLLLPDLNSALESCENELLKTLYASEAALARGARQPPSINGGHANHDRFQNGTEARSSHRDVPARPPMINPLSLESMARSPRQSDLHKAATLTLARATLETPHVWRSFSEPLRLMLHIFRTLSDRNEDFWFPAAAYFARQAHPPGTTLFRRGEPALGFYLVERGILRAEYHLPQGRLCESIVAGTTCGELPFFSATSRTATVVVDKAGSMSSAEEEAVREDGDGDGDVDSDGCVLWLLDKDAWERMRAEHADVAQELLMVSLKLTSERMSSITSYVLAVAG